MKTIVQKFGGTSIGRPERMINAAKIVQRTVEQDKRVVVVLSAMSSEIKAVGTTTNLMKAAQIAIDGGNYHETIDLLTANHLKTIDKSIEDKTIKQRLKQEVEKELLELEAFLAAIQKIGELSPRSEDIIVSTGEKLSARIFADVLNDRGTEAEYCNLYDIVQKEFKKVNHDFCLHIQEQLRARLSKIEERVPVVTGFFGFVPGGIIKSIGRGYTDFTAALIATSTNAQELQIWKEVDGIFTADPHKVEGASVLSSITPEEAMELTYYGSEVIHPFTMEQINNADIPLRIKNTFRPDSPGTIVEPKRNGAKKPGATAVTVKRGVTMVNIQSNRMLMAYGFMSQVFEIFAKHELVIDLTSTSEVNISLTLDEDENLQHALPELKNIGTVWVSKDMAIVSLIGVGMCKSVGTAGEMFERLAEHQVNIEAISQGASEINISCVIAGKQADTALKAVHEMLVE